MIEIKAAIALKRGDCCFYTIEVKWSMIVKNSEKIARFSWQSKTINVLYLVDKARGANKIAGCLAAAAGVNITVALLITSTCVASCPAVVPICAEWITDVGSIGAADVAALVKCFDN